MRRATSKASCSSPRAANRAASRAASTQRTCMDTAVMPDKHNAMTSTRATIARAASTVPAPELEAKPWCAAHDR